jgi:hypothetical protein
MPFLLTDLLCIYSSAMQHITQLSLSHGLPPGTIYQQRNNLNKSATPKNLNKTDSMRKKLADLLLSSEQDWTG